MSEQQEAVEVTEMKRSIEERQMRAMCMEFATRINGIDPTAVVAVATEIYGFVTGEQA